MSQSYAPPDDAPVGAEMPEVAAPPEATTITIPTWTLNGVQVTTPKHAATLTGLHWRTIYRWAQQGWVKSWYTPSGQLRVDVADLLRETAVTRQGRPRKEDEEG